MSEPSPQEQIARLMSGYWISQGLYVAAKLGLPDLLKEGPRDADSLAAASGAHGRSLYRLLRALASVGVFREDEQGRFGLTPLADCLRPDAPGSQWALTQMMGEELYQAYGGLLDSVRTGTTAFERIHGQPIFEYLATRPEQARIFDASMTAIHGRETQAMVDAYDFSGFRVLADIGGGNGSTLGGILKHYPALNGILYDLPGVIERAKPAVAAAGLDGRCRLVGGSFFESVPEGADAYVLRHIIHDWDDEKAGVILRNVRRALPAGRKLLVVESVIPPGNDPVFAKWLDITMLVAPGGEERTEEEYRRLYESAGFRLTRIVPTTADVSVIEGEPV